MTKVNDLLSSRFKKASTTLSKMTDLAEMSSRGNLSSFSGVFRVTPLSEGEQEGLRNLLAAFSEKEQETDSDLKNLSAITSEIKAITNQAAILHGERIEQAQTILKNYRDGAFTSWLIHTYGNRQTPYNFLQYYQLYTTIPKKLQEKLDEMPRQAVYTLATRDCSLTDKEEVIKGYKGETKKELLALIRERFPLKLRDKRSSHLAKQSLKELNEMLEKWQKGRFTPTKKQKKQLLEVLQSLQSTL